MSNTGVEYSLSLKDLFTPKIKQATTATEKLNGAVGKVQSSFSSIGGALGIGLGVAGVVSFGRSVLDSLKNYEYFSASLRTLMHGDARAAKALQSDLVNLAAKTPFSLTEVQDATKQLIAYGFSAGSVTKNISMLGDVASALKIPFSDIAYLYGTLKTQGRAYARDIMQFTQRGIPVVAELAKQFKVSESAVMKFVSEGKVGFSDVEKAFKSMTSEGGQFFNMMDEQSKTVGGQLSNMGDSWEQLKVNIGKSTSGITNFFVSMANSIVTSVNRATSAANDLDESFSKFGGGQDLSYGWMQKATENLYSNMGLGMFNVKGGYKDMLKYADRMQSTFVNPNGTKEQTLSDISLLKEEIQKVSKGGWNYTTDRKIAILQNVIEKNNDRLALLANGGNGKTALGASSSSTSAKGTSTDAVETRGHQSFNISIDKLVEKLEFNTTNLKDSANVIKEEVTKALIGAVNDFQIMATK